MTADRNEISRRSFTATTTLTAAAVVAGGARRVLGANDRVVVAIVGIRAQGNALKQGFAKLPGVEIKTLCDIDENLFASRAKDPDLSAVPGFRAYYVIYAPDDTVTAISIFDDYAGAEESNRRGLAWIEESLAPLLSGQATAVAGPVIVHTLA